MLNNPTTIGIVLFVLGSIIGYFVRQYLAVSRADSVEGQLKIKVQEAKDEAKSLVLKSKEEAAKILEDIRREEKERKEQTDKIEGRLIKREELLDRRQIETDQNQKKVEEDISKLKVIKEDILKMKESEEKVLIEIANLSKDDAKKILLQKLEDESKQELLSAMRVLENTKKEELEKKVDDIMISSIQRYGHGNASEHLISTVQIPSEDIKGRIIGKEGRNIRHFEKVSGVELIIDDSPDLITLSSFNPIRREIAKMALEKLILDGRIQPSKIEEKVLQAEQEIKELIKKAGEEAVYEIGILDLPPELVFLLGRLKYRTSYSQNVLTHSIEVAMLAGMIAAEVGADVSMAKKAGLLHDIGKAIDYELEGSHVEIGRRILQKYNIKEDIIKAMQSHHEDYPVETVEGAIIMAADAISASRPGARKENLENYLKRLEDLEKIATSFKEIEKAYAIQAGRELRVFVFPDKIDDYGTARLAKQIADKIKEEMDFYGEIKILAIRETRVIEYVK
ncbi:MAG: ribonuclease Y [Candidatus Paceibacterota bacterium]|jgi:ribonuclease Y